MNCRPIISVIVPVYNVEQYLDRCINSILKQSFKDFELILVDDGSPDNCGKKCDEWAEKDERIIVIHKTNGGLSDARNVGVLKSNTSYITFVDSDDYISKEYLSYLYSLIIKYDSDISLCYYVTTNIDNQFIDNNELSEDNIECISNSEACLRFCKIPEYGTATSKLFKKSLLLQNQFPINRFFEDTATVGKLFYNSKKVVVGLKKLYAYYQNPEGITQSNPSRKKREDQLWAVTENARFFDEKQESKIAENAWNLLPRVLLLNCNPGDIDKNNLIMYYEEYKSHANKNFIFLKVCLAVKFNKLYFILKNIKRIFKKKQIRNYSKFQLHSLFLHPLNKDS